MQNCTCTEGSSSVNPYALYLVPIISTVCGFIVSLVTTLCVRTKANVDTAKVTYEMSDDGLRLKKITIEGGDNDSSSTPALQSDRQSESIAEPSRAPTLPSDRQSEPTTDPSIVPVDRPSDVDRGDSAATHVAQSTIEKALTQIDAMIAANSTRTALSDTDRGR